MPVINISEMLGIWRKEYLTKQEELFISAARECALIEYGVPGKAWI